MFSFKVTRSLNHAGAFKKPSLVSKSHSCVPKSYSECKTHTRACRNLTRACQDQDLRAEITLEHVKIVPMSVKNTLRVKITLVRIEIILCV
jgi:hypothetical protein